nr:1310_t:CDS:2 [Entrophospora candida]
MLIDTVVGGAIRSNTIDNSHKADRVMYWKSNKLYKLDILEVLLDHGTKAFVKDSSDLCKLKREMKDCLNYVICKRDCFGSWRPLW